MNSMDAVAVALVAMALGACGGADFTREGEPPPASAGSSSGTSTTGTGASAPPNCVLEEDIVAATFKINCGFIAGQGSKLYACNSGDPMSTVCSNVGGEHPNLWCCQVR